MALVGGLLLVAGVTAAIAVILASSGSEPPLWVTDEFEQQESIRNLGCPSSNCSQPSLAPNGARMAFIGYRYGSVYVAEMKGAFSSGSTSVAGADRGIRPSLDKTGRVVFRDPTGIWYTDRAQQNAKHLTAGRGDSDPVWSPEGTQVAFDGRQQLLAAAQD